MELHKIILSLRTKNNYTQERLAEMLGVSTAAVSKWECANAYPDITLLPKIAEIFGVSVDYLLGYDLTAKKSISETITQANELRKVQKYDEADHLLKQTLARYPGNAQLTFELARHRLMSARYYGKTKRAELLSEAARDFQYTAEHDENKARRDWSLQYLTTICLIKQDFDQASEYNRMLLPTKGIHPLVMAAEIQMNRCADEKALKGLNDALMNCIFEIAMLIPWFSDYYMENGDYDAVIAENLRAAKANQEYASQRVKGYEADAKALKDKIQQLKTTQMGLKTNKEYQDFSIQIDLVSHDLEATENNQLAAMDDLPSAQARIDDAQAKYDAEKGGVDAFCAEIDERIAAVKAELAEAQKERAEKAKAVDDPKFMLYYERLRMKRWPVVVALTHDGVCDGCHLVQPPSVGQLADANAKNGEAGKPQSIVACTMCGRILYRA